MSDILNPPLKDENGQFLRPSQRFARTLYGRDGSAYEGVLSSSVSGSSLYPSGATSPASSPSTSQDTSTVTPPTCTRMSFLSLEPTSFESNPSAVLLPSSLSFGELPKPARDVPPFEPPQAPTKKKAGFFSSFSSRRASSGTAGAERPSLRSSRVSHDSSAVSDDEGASGERRKSRSAVREAFGFGKRSKSLGRSAPASAASSATDLVSSGGIPAGTGDSALAEEWVLLQEHNKKQARPAHKYNVPPEAQTPGDASGPPNRSAENGKSMASQNKGKRLLANAYSEIAVFQETKQKPVTSVKTPSPVQKGRRNLGGTSSPSSPASIARTTNQARTAVQAAAASPPFYLAGGKQGSGSNSLLPVSPTADLDGRRASALPSSRTRELPRPPLAFGGPLPHPQSTGDIVRLPDARSRSHASLSPTKHSTAPRSARLSMQPPLPVPAKPSIKQASSGSDVFLRASSRHSQLPPVRTVPMPGSTLSPVSPQRSPGALSPASSTGRDGASSMRAGSSTKTSPLPSPSGSQELREQTGPPGGTDRGPPPCRSSAGHPGAQGAHTASHSLALEAGRWRQSVVRPSRPAGFERPLPSRSTRDSLLPASRTSPGNEVVPSDLQPETYRDPVCRSNALDANVDSDAQPVVDVPPSSSFDATPHLEALLIGNTETLATILDSLDYASFRHLRQVSTSLRQGLSTDAVRELVLERFMGGMGYRSSSNTNLTALSLADLDALQSSLELSLSDFAIYAAEHKRAPLPMAVQRRVKASTRAHSRLVVRLREQATGTSALLPLSRPRWASLGTHVALHRQGRAATLRVWVTCASTWMTDDELVECEREIHRAGCWTALQRGDLVRNVAQSDIANEGVVIFDGRFLRDLSYLHDPIGHTPSWLNMLALSPSHYHNQLASSTSTPVIYLDLTPFAQAVQANMQLCKENGELTSPSGDRYRVNRYVYRTVIELLPGTLLGSSGSAGGAGPGGIEQLHPDWAGSLVIEVEGTSEAAQKLVQSTTPNPSALQHSAPQQTQNRPHNVLRNLSRPGQIWVRPVAVEDKH